MTATDETALAHVRVTAGGSVLYDSDVDGPSWSHAFVLPNAKTLTLAVTVRDEGGNTTSAARTVTR